MEVNYLVLALTALVPLAVGWVWYSRKVFGNAWLAATGLSPESGKDMNMFKVFGITYLVSFFVAFILQPIVIHQYGVFSVLINEPGLQDPSTEIGKYFSDFMAKYGHNFRTFKHGALHGTITGIFLIMPVITVNALFERRGFKYIAINTGFWTVCLAIMGGIVCAFG